LILGWAILATQKNIFLEIGSVSPVQKDHPLGAPHPYKKVINQSEDRFGGHIRQD